MNSKTIPAELPITMERVCTLSLECWRLMQIAESVKVGNTGLAVRHAARCIAGALKEIGIEVVDFAGRNYDPSMVPEVVEVREVPDRPHGRAVIDETIAPTVTWRGQVVKLGQIVVKRSSVRSQQ